MATRLPKGYTRWTSRQKSKYWADRRKIKGDLLNPNKPLAGQNLYNVAKAQVDLETKPQVSALDTQARSTRIQQGALASRAGGYYKELANQAQGQLDRIAATRTATATDQATINQRAQEAINQAQGIADAAQARDTGVRGGGLSGGGDERVRQELAAARGRAAEIGQSEASAGENLGANWEGYARQIAAATQMRGGEVQERLLNRLANGLSDIRQKKADIQAMAGPKLLDNLVKLRQQAFENAATASTLGQKELALKYQKEADDADRALNSKKLDVTAQQNRATNRLAANRIAASERNNRRTTGATKRGQTLSHGDRVRGQDLTHKDRLAAIQGKKKGAAKQMPAATQKARTNIENIRSIYQTQKKSGKGLGEIAKALRESGASNLEVNIGSALATRGFLTGSDIRKLKAAYPGIQIPASWKRHRGPKRVVSTR